ncbi:hypothetical protein BrE312_3039 [Brenneria sp. EniD312]|uniref:Uncharacterized protein n=1 Tax=Brenneria nigrifluens DSM 30175 = ATCC 13028 TaxID=1121120 RepID=A0A2U1UX46_9GAMM|nr:hypothetical protein BrE312_3039 [Brenneria sp. EniD312]PWC26208.1 hypothetical protein DDT54_02525 [Brenneria nigrifluens DSM 30175 = ATCC 13028]
MIYNYVSYLDPYKLERKIKQQSADKKRRWQKRNAHSPLNGPYPLCWMMTWFPSWPNSWLNEMLPCRKSL